MSGFIVTGKDGVSRPLRPEDVTGQRQVFPIQSFSETWSVNSNNPGQVQYSRTISQTREYYLTPAEYQDYQRRMNEWLAYQMELTRRASMPQRAPTLGDHFLTLGRNIRQAVKWALG